MLDTRLPPSHPGFDSRFRQKSFKKLSNFLLKVRRTLGNACPKSKTLYFDTEVGKIQPGHFIPKHLGKIQPGRFHSHSISKLELAGKQSSYQANSGQASARQRVAKQEKRFSLEVEWRDVSLEF